MDSKVVVLHADKEPIPGVRYPGPHQTYKNPRISIESRNHGALLPDEIRVEMIYAGLCGTDVHLMETNPDTGHIMSSAPAEIPAEGRVIGHEGMGQVVSVGENVRHLKPGAYITFESIIICQHCAVCRLGHFNQCLHALLLGLEKDGVFGTIVDIPSSLAHDVTMLATCDKGMRAAACIEPAGVAYVGCQNTHIGAGDVVVIFGAGPIGAFAAMLSKQVFGAASVHVVEPVGYRRELCSQWCDAVYTSDDFLVSGPSKVDVVIEASGKMANINGTFRRLNANGRVAVLGRSGTPLVIDAVDHMITNAVSIIGSRGHLGGAFSKIINLALNGRIDLEQVVTGMVEGPEGIRDILQSPEDISQRHCKLLARFH